MPTFQSSSFESDKKPTFREACRQGIIKSGEEYPTELIWLPGKFSTLTFQTEKFRLGVSSRGPSGIELLDCVEEFTKETYQFFVCVMNTQDYEWELDVREDKNCSWEFITDTGLKRNIAEVKATKSKVRKLRSA